MMKGGTPIVFIDGDERKFLMAIRNEEIPIENITQELDEINKEVTKFIDEESISHSFDEGKTEEDFRRFLSGWIINVRRKSFPRANSISPLIKNFHNLGDHNMFLLEKCNQLLRENEVEGFVIGCFVSGKFLHFNISEIDREKIENGEVDFIGIFVAKTENVLSLFKPKLRISSFPSGFISIYLFNLLIY